MHFCANATDGRNVSHVQELACDQWVSILKHHHQCQVDAACPCGVLVRISTADLEKCLLWRAEPVDVPQSSSDLSLLQLLSSQLLLLPGSELHVTFGFALYSTSAGAANCRWNSGADVGACHRGTWARILEAIHRNSQVSLLSQPSIGYVPLLGAKGTNKLLVVGNHDNTSLVITNGNGKTSKRVSVQEVRRLVEHEQVGVVLDNVSIISKKGDKG